MTGIPKEIWLQVGEDCDCADFQELMDKHGLDITWCVDSIEPNDIGPFVYAPEVDALKAENERLRKEMNEDRPYRDLWEAAEEEYGHQRNANERLRELLKEARQPVALYELRGCMVAGGSVSGIKLDLHTLGKRIDAALEGRDDGKQVECTLKLEEELRRRDELLSDARQSLYQALQREKELREAMTACRGVLAMFVDQNGGTQVQQMFGRYCALLDAPPNMKGTEDATMEEADETGQLHSGDPASRSDRPDSVSGSPVAHQEGEGDLSWKQLAWGAEYVLAFCAQAYHTNTPVPIDRVEEIRTKILSKMHPGQVIPEPDPAAPQTEAKASEVVTDGGKTVDVWPSQAFTDDEVTALKKHQENERLHPYTCTCDVPQEEHELIPGRAGLWCPNCGRCQKYAIKSSPSDIEAGSLLLRGNRKEDTDA